MNVYNVLLAFTILAFLMDEFKFLKNVKYPINFDSLMQTLTEWDILDEWGTCKLHRISNISYGIRKKHLRQKNEENFTSTHVHVNK